MLFTVYVFIFSYHFHFQFKWPALLCRTNNLCGACVLFSMDFNGILKLGLFVLFIALFSSIPAFLSSFPSCLFPRNSSLSFLLSFFFRCSPFGVLVAFKCACELLFNCKHFVPTFYSISNLFCTARCIYFICSAKSAFCVLVAVRLHFVLQCE